MLEMTKIRLYRSAGVAGALLATLLLAVTCADSSESRKRGGGNLPPPPPPPPGFEVLEAGFDGAIFVGGLDLPVKMALAPDGRLFRPYE